jgi:monovalent cation:H+ antiporter, CPA1 family
MKPWQIGTAIVAGVLVGIFEPGRFEYALGYTTLYVFLPPLLFEAAWNLSYRAILRQWGAIATLAGPGVFVTALIVAAALWVIRVDFGAAFLMGAILSATDPISVIAIFRSIKAPKTLVTIVECESLFNDAVAVVLYRGVLAALAVTVLDFRVVGTVALQLVAGVVGGVAFGIVLAFVVARAMRKARHAELQVAGTIVCAYGSYFAADRLHLSGIFATIACGIALRYFERRWITLNVAEDVKRFWDLAALAANALVFFLLGAALQIGEVAREPVFIVVCLVAIALSRIVVAGLLLPAGYPRSWLDVVRVAGVRGALSIALALAIPPAVPYRQAMIDASFAVAIATIIAGSLSAPRVVQRTVRLRGTRA